MAGCAKHFIGDGNTDYGTGTLRGLTQPALPVVEVNSAHPVMAGVSKNLKPKMLDQGNCTLSMEQLREKALPPFEAAIKAGVHTVMLAYS